MNRRALGFTLIELLTALVILSLLGLMSYRGLSAVLDARGHVAEETAKWKGIAAFFTRFERDVQLAMPGSMRGAAEGAPARLIELTRFGTADDGEPPRRIAYALNTLGEVELWLWSAPEAAQPERHRVLPGVSRIAVQYLDADLAWVDEWTPRSERALPLAVRVRLVLAGGEEIVRVFSLA